MRSILKAAVLTALGAAVAAQVHAEESPAAADATANLRDIDNLLEKTVVLGTSRQDTTALTSTAPVDIITPAQLKETGSVTINQALSKLHPSFNFPQGQNAVKGQGVRAASLRGVGPAYTLVLVNGKRRNVTAQLSGTDPWPAAQVVDINTIPVSAVDHVEVLRDGAAAQYGSDAIAGVINIVLKKKSSGVDLDARYGAYSDGGGQTHQYLGTTGFRIGERGFLNVSLDRLQNDNVDRSEGDWRQLFPNGDPRNTTYPAKYGQWGQSDRDNWTGLINAELEVTDQVRAYGWINYADKSARNYVNPERIVKANTQTNTATTPTRVSETAVLGVYPNGYQPAMTYAAKDWAAVTGLKFSNVTIGDLDFAVSYGRNETQRFTDTTINPSWGTASPTTFYLGSWKTNTTSVTLDYVKELPFTFLKSSVLSAGVLYRHELWGTSDLGDYIGYASGPLAGLTVASLYSPATPATIAIAGSYAGIYSQYASQFPGVNFATDTSVIPATGSSTAGIQSIDAGSITRDVRGAYLGLDAAVTDKLDVGLTGRFEDYSDFGSTSTYRLTARYEFIPSLAVRGTVSSGFHAPSLAELGQQSTGYTGTFTNNGISIATPGRTRQFRPNDPVGALFGAKALDPETSKTYSLGVVLRPDASSSITIDAYRLTINDVITNTDAVQNLAGLTNVSSLFNSVGLTGYTQATYYLNAWDTTTKGIDVVARKTFDFTGSTLALTASTSFLNTEVSNVHNQVTVSGATAANTVIGDSRIRDAETGVPKNKIIVNGRYSIADWAFDLTATRYSSYRYNVGNVPNVATANGNIDQEFTPETYIDVGIDYRVLKKLRLSAAVQNVFNHYPDQYVTGNRSSGINPYSFIAPNGASGRFIQVGVSYQL